MRKILFSITLLLWTLYLAVPQLYAQDVTFVPNQGQWQDPFAYKVLHPQADVYIKDNGMMVVVGHEDNQSKMHAYKESIIEEESILYYHAYQVEWLNANAQTTFEGSGKQKQYHNYFLGDNPANWKSKVPLFHQVLQKDIYDGVDLVYKSEGGVLKYDLVVHPHGNVQDIQMKIHGAEGVAIRNGQLVIRTSVGEVVEQAPYAYQSIQGAIKEVPANFKIVGENTIAFQFPKRYNKSYPLIIDPEVIFATMTGSTADNWGFTTTYDDAGHLFAGGIANGLGYPTTTGAFQVTYGGGNANTTMPCDITITKFNPMGTDLIYSTYLGGSMDEMPHSLIVDNTGALIVAGKTNSENYPVTTNAYQGTKSGGYDIVLTKFNAAGTALLGSTFLGGSEDDGVNISISYFGDQSTIKYNYGDGFRSEVIVDDQNNIYLAGSTQSNNFPITTNAAKSTLGGDQDGVFVKMNPQLSQLTYSTYIGGTDNDAAYVLALDQQQNFVYVAGGTMSNNFHTSNLNGLHTSYQGGMADGYILKFQNSGTYSIVGGTMIGTNDYDQVYGIEVDLSDQVYVMGQTLGNFPVSAGVYSNPGSRQFVMKLPPALNQVTYSTVYGSGSTPKPNISPVAFLVDTCENVYISGWASPQISSGTSTANMPITPNAFQSTTDNADFYFIVLNKNANDILLGSYFGADGKMEHVDGGTARFDSKGVVYQSMCASCGSGNNFPATPGAYASVKGASNCNLGAIKIAFNLGSVEAEAQASPAATGCAPLTVNFENLSSNGTQWQWDFDDGNTSTQYEPTHTFTQPGAYNVRLVAHNPNACKEWDTAYVQVIVSDLEFEGDFTYTLHDICTQPYIVINPSISPAPGYTTGDIQFNWNFGDGGTFNGMNPPNHYYTAPGTYQVTLTMTQDGICNSPLTVTKTVEIYPVNVEAAFDYISPICEGQEITFTNLSQNGTSYFWSCPPLGTSTSQHASYTFNQTGSYEVMLVASNPESCNLTDTMKHVVEVLQNAQAAFEFSPNPPGLNEMMEFQNLSPLGNQFHWDFGDGNTSNEMHPNHTYVSSGSYNVCLTATFDNACPHTVCKEIRAQVIPAADLPTAFSPNGDGENDVLYVRGYNIESIHLQIFNRWGQMVFESFSMDEGWDGTFLGEPQPMEVYGYVLNVKFLDGKSENFQGNVTLLR